jgi:dipeptidyl aminopeptidase/acylaminoacyl peptidase
MKEFPKETHRHIRKDSNGKRHEEIYRFYDFRVRNQNITEEFNHV